MNQLTEFIQHIKKNSIARTNRYMVNIALPSALVSKIKSTASSMPGEVLGRTAKTPADKISGNVEKILSLTCLIADIPGYQEQTTSLEYGSLPRRIVHGKSQGDFTTTFLVTGNYTEKKLFDMWHKLIMNEAKTAFEYYDNYVSGLQVDSLNEADEVVYTFNLTEVYPISVSQIRLDRTAQNQQMVLDVTWAYHNINSMDYTDITEKISKAVPTITEGGIAGVKRLLPIPGLDSFSSGVKSAMDTVKGFKEQVSGALQVAKDVREQVRDLKMQVNDGIKMLNGVVKDVRAIRNIPIDIKNEVAETINATKNELGTLKNDSKLITSPFPKR